MEPSGESVDQSEAGAKQIKDDDVGVVAIGEQATKSSEETMDVTSAVDVQDGTADIHAKVCVENGNRSPLAFPSALCPEEGLASRIGLVELGKGPESESGKTSAMALSPSSVQTTVDGCGSVDKVSTGHVPTGDQDNCAAINSLKSFESKVESDVSDCLKGSNLAPGEVSVVRNEGSASEKAEASSVECHGANKESLCAKPQLSDAEKCCVVEDQLTSAVDAQTAVSECDGGMKEGCVGGCAAEESSCADGRAKKRRAEEVGSDVDASRVENEAVGDRLRKRRKRKSRRKAPNVSVTPSSASSSGDERETQRSRPQQGRRQGREDAATSEDEQQFCLRWNNFLTNITSQFGTLRDDEDFVDVTLACGGMHVKAHRVVLSACSPYFKRMFKSVPYCQHPVVFLEGIHPSHLLSLLAFMYCGEVGVGRGQLPALLSAAHALQIRGLTEMGSTAGGGSARSGEEGDEDEEKVVLSARRQALAVERVLKDIGFSEMEGTSGRSDSCAMNLPKAAAPRGGERVPVASRQRSTEGKATGTQNGASLANGLGEHQAGGNCIDGAVPGSIAPEMNGGDERFESRRCVERRTWPNAERKHHLAPSSQRLVPVGAEMDVPSAARCGRKVHRDANNLLNCGIVLEEGVTRVNSHRPESLLMCNMAASLVDVRMGSSPMREENEGRATKGLADGEQSTKNNPTQSSPTPDVRGTGMERHGWDPGEEGTQETSSHFEPRIDLVMGTQLIKPKEEFVQFGSDLEDNVSLSNAIEPKMECQDVSSAEEGETSCGIPLVAVPTGPSLSLVTLNEPPQTYRPHILSSPIVNALQQQPRPTPSSSSSHVYSHFLPPIGTSAHGVPPHAASSPGSVAAMGSAAGDRRGGADGSGGGGHLKWEMPRPCPVCRRIYSNNSNLRRHLRTIHEEYYEAHMQ